MQNNLNTWEELSTANLIEGDKVQHELESPWFIKLLLSISGWFGAFFLIIAFGGTIALTIGDNVENLPFLLVIVGGGIIYFTYRQFQEKQSDFLDYFFLALSMVGQVMVITFIIIIFDEYRSKSIYLFVALFQAYLMWVIPNYIHRMMSSFFMALAWSYLFYSMGMSSLYLAILAFIVAWLWMNEFNFDKLKKIQAIAYGQLVALIYLKSSELYAYNILSFFAYYNHNFSIEISPFLIVILLTIILGFVVWKILEQNNKLKDKKLLSISLIAVVLLGLLSLKVSGLLTGIMLLLIGFSSSHRLLMGLGVLSSLFFISNYYYFMGETLLDKAIVLALVGTLLLVARWLVNKFIFKEESSNV